MAMQAVSTIIELTPRTEHYVNYFAPNFTKFLCMLPVAMAWSSFDGIAIPCVHPVLWITSYRTIGPLSRIW